MSEATIALETVVSPTLSRRERKKLETRQRIFEAAMDLFSDRGYVAVTIEEICDRADVANATFFLHFPTKAALLTEFNHELTARVAAKLDRTSGTAKQKLRVMREELVAEWNSRAEIMREMVREFVSQPASHHAVGDATQDIAALVTGIIREGQNTGEFSDHIDPEIVAVTLISAWNAVAIGPWLSGATDLAHDANLKILDLIVGGLDRGE